MSDFAKCLNCDAPLNGPYCASCGQRAPHTDLTLRDFITDATQELMQWDGKVPHTLKTLFTKPGVLTLDFLAGRRARWLSPLRIYLICSIAYFVSGVVIESLTHRSERELAKVTTVGPEGGVHLTPAGRAMFQGSLLERVFGLERLERAIANNAQFNRAIESAFPKAMFLLVPFFALLTFIAWSGRQEHYPAHLYLALHLHAAWFGALVLVNLLTMWTSSTTVLTTFGFISLGYVAIYSLLTLRRVFAESWVKTAAKLAAVAIVYSAILSVVSIVILGYALATT